MASPIVAGLAALMRQDAPDLPAADLVRCLRAGATPVEQRHKLASRTPTDPVNLDGISLVNAPAAYSCVVNPEPPSAEEIAALVGCSGECSITGAITLDHPSWGPITLATYHTEPSSDLEWPNGIVVFDTARTERWRLDLTDDPWNHLYEFYPAGERPEDQWTLPLYEDKAVQGSIDALGHIFLSWNPGRYDGLMVLRPTDNGFDVVDTSYLSRTVDMNGDGQFEILDIDDCELGCSGASYGSFAAEPLYWDGVGYSPQWDNPFTFPVNWEKYQALFGSLDPDTAMWSGCSPGTPDTLPDGVWYGWIEDWDSEGVEFDLVCNYPPKPDADYGTFSNSTNRTRFLKWAKSAQAYAWSKDDAYNYLSGPWTTDQLISGDAKLLSPVGEPGWPAPPALLYVNDGAVTELEAIFES